MSARTFLTIMLTFIVVSLVMTCRAEAGPVSGCVTEFPESYTVTSGHHLVVNAFEWHKGCEPSGPGARPTAGMYERSYGNGTESVTFYARMFNPNCSTQGDIREEDDFGNIFAYWDFIYNPPGATGPCFGGSSGIFGGGSGDLESFLTTPVPGMPSFTPPGYTPPGTPPGDTPNNPPGIPDQHNNPTPVPEPATVVLMATGLYAAWRSRR